MECIKGRRGDSGTGFVFRRDALGGCIGGICNCVGGASRAGANRPLLTIAREPVLVELFDKRLDGAGSEDGC